MSRTESSTISISYIEYSFYTLVFIAFIITDAALRLCLFPSPLRLLISGLPSGSAPSPPFAGYAGILKGDALARINTQRY